MEESTEESSLSDIKMGAKEETDAFSSYSTEMNAKSIENVEKNDILTSVGLLKSLVNTYECSSRENGDQINLLIDKISEFISKYPANEAFGDKDCNKCAEQTSEDLKNIEKYKAMCEEIKSENENLRETLKEVEIQKEKSEKRASKLASKLKEFKSAFENVLKDFCALKQENEENKAIIEQLQNKISENRRDNDEFQLKLDLKTKENEVESLKNLLQSVSDHYEDQKQEIECLSSQRTKLVNVVQQLSNACIKAEDMISAKDAIIKEMENNVPLKKDENEQNGDSLCSNECDSIDNYVDLLSDEYSHLKPVLLDSSRPLNERLEIAFSAAKENAEKQEKKEKEKLNKEIDLLNNCIDGELRFIEEIANNKQIQSWLLHPRDFGETKARLVEQSLRINNFLIDNNISRSGKCSLFDAMLTNCKVDEVPKDLESFFNTFDDVKTPTENQLFVLLKQSLCANDILRCMLIELKANALKNAVTIHDLMEENERNSKANEFSDVKSNDHSKELEKANEKIQALKSIIRLASLKSEPNSEVNDILELANSNDEIDVDEINDTFNDHVDDLRKQNSDLIKEIAIIKDENEQRAEDFNAKIEEMNKKLEAAQIKECEYKDEIKERDEQIKELSESLNKKSKKLEKVETQLSEQKEIKENAIKTMQIKHENEMRETKDAMEKEKEETVDSLCLTINELKAINKKLLHKCELYRKKNKETKEHHQELVEVLKKDVVNAEAKNKISETEIAKLNKQIEDVKQASNEIGAQLNSSKFEVKTLNMQIAQLKESFAKQQILDENRYKAKEFAQEIEYKKLINEEANKLSEYKELVGKKLDVSPEEIIEKIDYLKEKAKRNNDMILENFNLLNELDSCRQLFGKESVDLKDSISCLIQQCENKDETIKNLQEEVNEYSVKIKDAEDLMKQGETGKEWEDWARRMHIYTIDSFTSMKTSGEIRSDLESLIFSSVNGKRTLNKLNSIRAQKKILLSGNKLESNHTELTLSSLVKSVVALNRMQRIAGHSSNYIGIGNNLSCYSKEIVPLFSRFVI